MPSQFSFGPGSLGGEDFIPGGTGTTASETQTDINTIFDRVSRGISIAERVRGLFDDGRGSEQVANMNGTSSQINSRQPVNLPGGTDLSGIFDFIQNTFKGGAKVPIVNQQRPDAGSQRNVGVAGLFSPLVLGGIAVVAVIVIVAITRR